VRLLFTRRDFALAWLGSLISLTGDWMLQAALPVYIYQLTGSTLATGAMVVAVVTPRLLLGSIAGVFVDRWDRRRTLIVANLVLACGLSPLLLVRSSESLWLVYVVAFTMAALAQVVKPAEAALLPRLVPGDDLVSANSLYALNGNLSRLIGPALGGLLVATAGLGWVALVDGLSFVLASVLTALIATDARPPARSGPASAPLWTSVWHDWRDGLRLIRSDRTLSVIFGFTAVSAVGEGAMAALFAPFVIQVLQGGEVGYGTIVSAQAIGGLVGSVALTARPRVMAPAWLMGLGALGLATVDLLTFNYFRVLPGIVPAIVLMALVGIPIAGLVVGMTTLTQIATTDAYRGRVVGAMTAVAGLSSLIGAILGGTLAERLGIVTVLNVQGFGYGLAGLLVLMLLARRQPTEPTAIAMPRACRSRAQAGTLPVPDQAC
jgi:MFS family permease